MTIATTGLAPAASSAPASASASVEYRKAESSYATCTHAGIVEVDPGISTTARDISFVFSGTVSCRLPDGTWLHGEETGEGTGEDATCAHRVGYARATIRWEDGKKSIIQYHFTAAGSLVNGTGSFVVGGRWEGSALIESHALSGFSALDCDSEAGVTIAEYAGPLEFGLP